MANTKRIEGKGVTAVNELVLNSHFLTPHLDFNDKTDSWDGFIFVYSDVSNRKSALLGRVPVQVKASEVNSFSGKSKTKAFDVSDLRNYKNDGGIIIFNIECFGHNRRIYFISLLPYDLDLILKDLKAEQKTRNVRLEQIEVTNINELENICKEFLMHRKEQFSLPNFVFPQDRVQEIMVQGIVPDRRTFEKRLLSKPNFLYGKTHANSPVYDCVSKINIDKIKRSLNKPISIGNKVCYHNYNVVSTRDYEQLLFGNNVKFIIKRNELTINYTFSGTLDEQINDIEFIVEFITKKSIKIADVNIPLLNQEVCENDKELRKIKEAYEYIVNIVALLDIFGVDHNKLVVSNLSNDEQFQLDILINSMVLNNPAPRQEKMPGIYRFKIGDISLLTYINENINSKVEIYDFNTLSKGEVRLVPEGDDSKEVSQNGIDISPYIILSSDGILCANIDIDAVVHSVTSYAHSSLYDNSVLLLCLNMIKAFDKTQNYTLLNCSRELLHWIDEEYCDKDILLVNHLQIVKRKRKFTQDEVKLLYDLKEKSKEDIPMLCGISILLEDISSFKNYFQTLSEPERSKFEDYPIYNLLNNH